MLLINSHFKVQNIQPQAGNIIFTSSGLVITQRVVYEKNYNLNLKKVHLIYILSRHMDEFYHCPVPTFFVLICAFFCILVVGLRSRDDNKKCSLYFNLFTLFFISGFCTLMFVGWILKKKNATSKICSSFAPHFHFGRMHYNF